MGFVFWTAVVFLVLALAGAYGHSREFYGSTTYAGLLIAMFLCFWAIVICAGPYWMQ